ncbi:MAG: glycosyltransferase family 4 protein [Verrucomicrobia bacterium]|nr:glycosyltransferase family 4 protein [Verrucomicrobiota bacterium]
MLLIFEAHPVPYHAPVFRALQQDFDVPVHVVYGSDFSLSGYLDKGFATQLSWDETLLHGYSSQFLSRVAEGGAKNYEEVRPWGMTKLADAHPASAVLSIGYYASYDLSGIGYAIRRGLPLLFRGETNDETHARWPIYNLMRTLYLRRLYARCSAMLYIGQRSKEHFQRYGAPSEKLFFSPYCTDESYFESSPTLARQNRGLIRAKLGISNETKIILFSGKLSKKKGVDYLPAAIRLLPEDLQSKVHLMFVGDGPAREDLEAQISQHPKVAASFAGFQNQDALASYYQAADMLVLPSRERETWGVVINEALINGLPCIVSDGVGCHLDLIKPGVTGEVFVSKNIEALAKAIQTLLARLPDESISLECLKQAERYSVTAAAEGIAKAWRSLPHL